MVNMVIFYFYNKRHKISEEKQILDILVVRKELYPDQSWQEELIGK